MPVTTPKKIDELLRSFGRSLKKDAPLLYVDVRPATGAQPLDCFNNVPRCVEAEGGTQLFGWVIWIWPGVFVEAEHHSVWRKVDGTLSDPTPRQQGETRVLFLEDESLLYDFEKERRRDNVRAALTQDRAVTAYLDASAEFHAFMEAHSDGLLIRAPKNEIVTRARRNYDLLVVLRRRYLKPNDHCPCGSGNKLKKCCGMEAAITVIPRDGAYKPVG
jgi:hypothetical protein